MNFNTLLTQYQYELNLLKSFSRMTPINKVRVQAKLVKDIRKELEELAND